MTWRKWFESPIKLHYSQTYAEKKKGGAAFESPIKLHYSQTSNFGQNPKNSPTKPEASSAQGHKNHYLTVSQNNVFVKPWFLSFLFFLVLLHFHVLRKNVTIVF